MPLYSVPNLDLPTPMAPLSMLAGLVALVMLLGLALADVCLLRCH